MPINAEYGPRLEPGDIEGWVKLFAGDGKRAIRSILPAIGQSSGRQGMLSIEDRFAVQDLYARYCACMDTGDIKGWANSWVEDGVFDSYQYHDGRAKIEEYGRGYMKRKPEMKWTNGQHWNNNIIVEGDGKTAKGLCYLVVIGKMKDTEELKVCVQAMYRDDLVKLPDGQWKFKRRKLALDTPPPDAIPNKA